MTEPARTGPARTRPARTRSATIVRRLSALLKRDMLSANLAIGTASAFVLVTAAASLAVDRDAPTAGSLDGAWRLRGSLSRVETRDGESIRPRRSQEIKAEIFARL